MKLADLRRLAIRKQIKIHFRLRNGLECLVDEQGVARVPALQAVPDFNVEDELSAAGEFLVEPAPPSPPRRVQRGELATMAAGASAAAPAHDHEDE